MAATTAFGRRRIQPASTDPTGREEKQGNAANTQPHAPPIAATAAAPTALVADMLREIGFVDCPVLSIDFSFFHFESSPPIVLDLRVVVQYWS